MAPLAGEEAAFPVVPNLAQKWHMHRHRHRHMHRPRPWRSPLGGGGREKEGNNVGKGEGVHGEGPGGGPGGSPGGGSWGEGSWEEPFGGGPDEALAGGWGEISGRAPSPQKSYNFFWGSVAKLKNFKKIENGFFKNLFRIFRILKKLCQTEPGQNHFVETLASLDFRF